MNQWIIEKCVSIDNNKMDSCFTRIYYEILKFDWINKNMLKMS